MKIGVHSFIGNSLTFTVISFVRIFKLVCGSDAGSVISVLVLETKSDDGVCVMWNMGYYECDKTTGGTHGFVIPKNVSADAKVTIKFES